MDSVLRQIRDAAARLRTGEVVAVPTETVYGLAASIHSEEALRTVFRIKDRPYFDPLIVHIGRRKDLRSLIRVEPSSLTQALMARFWPGPLTIVFPKSESVSPLITSGLETVAVRMPAHPVARRVAQLAGPFAAPSANRFGRTSPTTAAHVRDEFPDVELLVLDAGPSEVGIESTVIEVRGEEEICILRPGMIDADQLRVATNVSVVARGSDSSPGNTAHHYQPNRPLYLLDSVEAQLPALQSLHGDAGAELVLGDDPRICAHGLYSLMREISMGSRFLYVTRPSTTSTEAWRAIWDRLERAKTAFPAPLKNL